MRFKTDEEVIDERVKNNASRGTVVRLYYFCEDATDLCHGFLQDIEFHEGIISETTTPLYVGKDNLPHFDIIRTCLSTGCQSGTFIYLGRNKGTERFYQRIIYSKSQSVRQWKKDT